MQKTSERKVKKPTEGKWFYIEPAAIDQKLFEEPRSDSRQEFVRRMILEAFSLIKKYPEKYTGNFKTMIPEKTWEFKIVTELEELGALIGDRMADWAEQALEWAQRIANGETWDAVCNKSDKAKWYRMIEGKAGWDWIVGGSCKHRNRSPATNICRSTCRPNDELCDTVPLVVLYENAKV